MLDTQNNPYIQFLFLLLLIGSTIWLFIQTSQSKKKEAPRKIITVIECSEDGKEKKRDFQEGDYIGKTLGGCGEHGVEVIKAIYTIEEKQQPASKPGITL
ncbi:MAG: hypothetical protein F7B59_06370 [Desulfurococcales archaeon]|nr:hypothetical protein [Desulfurococcales archaeon]